MEQATTILVAESDPANLEMIARLLEEANYTVVRATSGAQALGELKHTPSRFGAAILQCQLPDMNCMALLKQIKAHPLLKVIPLIVQGEGNNEPAMVEALRTGAHSYLDKPTESKLLLAVIQTAVKDYLYHRKLQEEIELRQSRLNTMQAGHFRIRTLDEATDLGSLIASAYPESGMIVVGLTELLINAIEHGTLEIGYQGKSELLATGKWLEEIQRRQTSPQYADRYVDVVFQRLPGEIRINIKDQGNGFDWRPYMDIRPERIFDTHGRGIAIARQVSFDELEYRGCGNEVEVANFYPGDSDDTKEY